MNQQHILLLALWFLFCLFHSLLANQRLKFIIKHKLGNYFRYYRISYSVFAAITLAVVLWFQFRLNSPSIFPIGVLNYFVALVFLLPGAYFMIVSIYKYFNELSGIQVLRGQPEKHTLQQDGLHKFVRHPLYFGTLLCVWGLFVIIPLLSHFLACIVISLYTLIGIRLEEKQLLSEYGEAYKSYAKKVPGLIPRIGMGVKK